MTNESISLMDGRLHLYRRPNSRYWQCSTYLIGRNFRISTKQESIPLAKEFAIEWYMEVYAAAKRRERGESVPPPTHLRGGHPDIIDRRRRPIASGPTFKEAADAFMKEFVISVQGERNENYARSNQLKIDLHLMPFFKHRGWFSPEEYKTLYEATRDRADKPKKERWRGECAQFHDYVLIMGNTGLRPDEASRLQFRDVSIVTDHDTGERILEIEVRGKRGVGYCKSMPGAVHPFERLCERRTKANGGTPPARTELVFGKVQRELLNTVLTELGLKKDRDGNVRTAYSLRHTYICMRLMEGADIYQIAKNCRTSVEMIETYYASHIKNTLDASQINVRKPKRPAQSEDTPAGAPPSP
jgi:integrase